MGSNQIYSGTETGDRDRYIHLKEVFVNFIWGRPTSVLELVLENNAGDVYESNQFKECDLIHWNLDTYVRAHTCATLTIQQAPFKVSVAPIEIEFNPNEFGDYRAVGLLDFNRRVAVTFVCGRSKSLAEITRALGSQAHTNLASTAPVFLKLPQVAALPPTSKRGYNAQYPAIHQLNYDVLLGVFNCYRLDEKNGWNDRLGWCKLSQVCKRWRHVIYECAFHLGMHITCTNGSPIVDTLDHFPPLPLCLDYDRDKWTDADITTLTERDELGIYHALRLHDRVYRIQVHVIHPSSILHKVFALLDGQFPILERLSLSFAGTSKNSLPPTLPKAFLAPNLRHLALPSTSPPRRLRFLTSSVSLVTLKLSNIETSSYFRSRLLVARLASLPLLEELSIEFSIPIPRPSAERDLLGEQRAPVTLPSLKRLEFEGVGAYLESLIAQIRAPLLENLWITLFNQIAFALPHLSHLINITAAFKLCRTEVVFHPFEVRVITANHNSGLIALFLDVRCNPLDWQIDCATQISHALNPALSGVEDLTLYNYEEIPTELQNGGIDSGTWHDLLRTFIGVKKLYIDKALSEELSRVLQVDGVGLDPGFLPNLQSISARRDLFTSFIDTRQVVGRPVQFVGY